MVRMMEQMTWEQIQTERKAAGQMSTEQIAAEMTTAQRKEYLPQMTADYEKEQTVLIAAQDHRASYHLMPPVGWLNDPNGLCYFKDRYHIFFQYSPFTPEGGMKLWGHYIGKDLIHYEYEGAAIYPDEPYDRDGVYSGSAICVGDRMYVFYTGNVKEEGEHDYIHSGRGANVVRMESEDGIHFTQKQCILTNQDYPEDCTCHVRDPKLFVGRDGAYRMVLGARLKEDKGAVLLYRSEDLLHFTFEEMYTTPASFGYMWECPDIFTLGDTTFLAVCPQGLEQGADRFQNIYQAGYFAAGSQEFTEWDMGFDFYAPQTFEAPDGRRILIGWAGVPDAGYSSNPDGEGWQHCLTIPRELTVRENRIYQYPVREMVQLRIEKLLPDHDQKVVFPEGCGEILAQKIKGTQGAIYIGTGCVVKWNQDRVTLSFEGKSGAGRAVRNARIFRVDSIRILIDVSILEIYINRGEVVMTSRFFMTGREIPVHFEGNADRLEYYRIGGDSCEDISGDRRGVD